MKCSAELGGGCELLGSIFETVGGHLDFTHAVVVRPVVDDSLRLAFQFHIRVSEGIEDVRSHGARLHRSLAFEQDFDAVAGGNHRLLLGQGGANNRLDLRLRDHVADANDVDGLRKRWRGGQCHGTQNQRCEKVLLHVSFRCHAKLHAQSVSDILYAFISHKVHCMSNPHEKSIYLYMTEGSSDKEYHVHLRACGDAWGVQYANGPRGRVGKTKMKTETPVTLDEAQEVFKALVKSKIKTGYTEAETGVRFTNTEMAHQASGHVQQLPTGIDRQRADELTKSDRFAIQEKANGERCSIEVRGGKVRGINKLGLYRDLPENVAHEMAAFGEAFMDGELVGNTYYVFDLLDYRGDDLRGRGFGERYAILEEEVLTGMFRTPQSCLQLLHASFTTDGKREKIARIEEENREGWVYKEVATPYLGGRSDAVFKFKLVESATCIVAGANAGRSVGIALLNAANDLVPVGNVTIPSNHAMPKAGELVEVAFLYFNPGGAFEQPVYQGPRNDILREECLITQVKRLKPGVYMDDMGRRSEAPIQAAGAPPRHRMRA